MHSTADLLLPMFQDAIEMLSLTSASFQQRDPGKVETAAALGRVIHKHEKELTEQLLAQPPELDGLRFVPSHLERSGDAIEGLLRCLRNMEAEGTKFTPGGTREVSELLDKAIELLECTRDLAMTRNRVLARHIELESMRFEDRAAEFARAHEERLVQGVCMPEASSTYLAMLDYLREITRHARRMGTRIVPREAVSMRGAL